MYNLYKNYVFALNKYETYDLLCSTRSQNKNVLTELNQSICLCFYSLCRENGIHQTIWINDNIYKVEWLWYYMYEYMVAIYRRTSKEKKPPFCLPYSPIVWVCLITPGNHDLGYQFCPWGRLLFSLAGERWIVQVHVADLNYLY